MRDVIGPTWIARDYAEGTVAGVILDAWLRELGPTAATHRLIGRDAPGMPQTDEMWAAAERAGVLGWDATEDLSDWLGDQDEDRE